MAQIYHIEDELVISDSCLCFLKPGTTVLEFGSATGYATQYMKEKLGCRVTCIEKVPEMVEKGRLIADKMIQADVETDIWEKELDQQFDFIVFADILEHLKEPSKVVARAKPFLKSTGKILTSIPNIAHNAIIMSLRNGKFNYTETGLLDNTHIHFMTRKSIMKMFEENGLFCAGEENKFIRPSDTELKTYYCQNPLLSLSLISNPDGHVYRFVHAWTFNKDSQIMKNEGIKMNFFTKIFELSYDIASFVKRKFEIDTPRILTFLVHKPIERKQSKRYEKYNS